MKIEGNQKELDAMVEFHKGNRVEGLRLQEEFAVEFRKEYKDKDHCPCLKACRFQRINQKLSDVALIFHTVNQHIILPVAPMYRINRFSSIILQHTALPS